MGFYSDTVVPRLVTCACGTKPILKQREKVVPLAQGKVLEIGMGAGHNLPYYDAQRVDAVVGIDPARPAGAGSKQSFAVGVPLEFVQGSAEEMPLPSESFDTVLMTFSLCTIPDGHAALQEIRRVLKPEEGWCFASTARRLMNLLPGGKHESIRCGGDCWGLQSESTDRELDQ